QQNKVIYFNASTCNDVTQSGCSSTPATFGSIGNNMALDVAMNKLCVTTLGGAIDIFSLPSNTLVAQLSTTGSAAGFFEGTAHIASFVTSPNNQDILVSVITGEGDVLASLNLTSDTITGVVSWNTGSDAMG